MRNRYPALLAAVFGSLLLGWVPARDPMIAPDMDTGVALGGQACGVMNGCDTGAENLTTQWVSRTQGGNLFLVVQKRCAEAPRCNAWFVERTARGVGMRLNIEGQFRVIHSGGRIPDVQTWRPVSDHERVYSRYRWVDGAFLKVETRSVYSVDGHECGTALECYQAATAAHENHETGKALKIWEQVHSLSWI
jgi:hypothetical protein